MCQWVVRLSGMSAAGEMHASRVALLCLLLVLVMGDVHAVVVGPLRKLSMVLCLRVLGCPLCNLFLCCRISRISPLPRL